MPTFTATVNADVDVDFEVFCGGCGAGLCNQSSTRESRRRNFPQVTVEPCQVCIDAAKEDGREEIRATLEATHD